MSEITDLVVIEPKNAVEVFKSGDQIEEIISKVERDVLSFVPDTSTAKGRKEIASLAYKVSQSKSYLDGLGKDLVAELKEIPKLIDANRKTVRDRFDALRDKARQPLTDWEAEQERIKAEQQMLAWHREALEMNAAFDKALAERIESDHEIALLMNDKFDRDLAEARAESERQRIAHDEELKRQAAEQAKREVEEKAERERAESVRREAELKFKAEQAERERKEAQERAEQQRLEALAKAERDRQAAIEAERQKAQEQAARIKRESDAKEAARLAEEKRIADENARRASDINNRKKVNNEALGALLKIGITEDMAKKIITAIAKNEIPNIQINY
ncbi:cell envelope biogenesis protein TolA [Brenneria sp. 4F2]|nr:cell envelope biogenesis protein TolA [Brenneria bubanii]